MICFKKIDDTNLEIAKLLKVFDNQRNMVESVEESMDEAAKVKCWNPILIYDGQKNIGFAMYGLWENEGKNGRLFLDRFFIDKNYQGKGYAHKVLPLLIDMIQKAYNRLEIFLSVYKNNVTAINIYKSFGFEFTGELDVNGEEIMKLCKPVK